MAKIAGVFMFLCLILICLYIKQIQVSKQRLEQVQELTNKLSQLEQKTIKDNQIIANNEITKRNLENQSLELQEKIDGLLKNNQCANEYVPSDITNSLYERAKSLHQSTNIRKLIN